MRRKRPSYEANTLQSRSQLLQMRPLLSKGPDDKNIEALEAKLDRLTKASSKQFTGRKALFQDLSRTSKHLVGVGKQEGAGEQKRILSMHGQLWRGMDASQQAVRERDAGRRRAETEVQSQNQVGEVLCDLEAARSRRQEARRQRPQLQVDPCRLSQVVEGADGQLGGEVS